MLTWERFAPDTYDQMFVAPSAKGVFVIFLIEKRIERGRGKGEIESRTWHLQINKLGHMIEVGQYPDLQSAARMAELQLECK